MQKEEMRFQGDCHLLLSLSAKGIEMKLDRITMNPEVVNGQPCIRHMRLPVKWVLEALGALKDWQVVLQEYPGLEEEDIRQSLVTTGDRPEWR